MWKVTMFVGLLVVAFAVRAEKVAPTKEIEVTTEVGATGAALGKLSVEQKATITKKGATYSTSLVQSDSYVRLIVPEADVEPLIKALASAAEKIDDKYEAALSSVKIETGDFGGKRYVKLRSARERISSDTIYVDAEGAASLSDLLKKSVGVVEWMKDRVAALDPKKAP